MMSLFRGPLASVIALLVTYPACREQRTKTPVGPSPGSGAKPHGGSLDSPTGVTSTDVTARDAADSAQRRP
jgi:hypothetical protein